MRVLVTNTSAPQAYAVIRALRPHAEWIVATLEGEGRLRPSLSHAALSRLVDRRCRVPSPVGDWWAGNVGPQNTPGEEVYVAALLRICRSERIDAVYPSWDPHVYVLAKNRSRFEAEGVVVPVPDYETVLTALDKYRTVEAAREIGFPVPRTRLFECPEDLDQAAEELGFPLVLKPRFTSGGRGMAIVRERADLRAAAAAVVRDHGGPLIQEYIPGGQRGSVQLVLGREGDVVFAFHKKRRRKLRLNARWGTVSESAAAEPELLRCAGLIARLGLWGALGIETIVDPRDGVHKLMEINARYPRQLWNRVALGINEPLMCLRIAAGRPVQPVADYPLGVLFVSPVEDVGLLLYQLLDRAAYTLRHRLATGAALDPLSAPPGVRDQLRSFLATYRSDQRKVVDPYFRFFVHDPAVSVVWWLQFCSWLAGGWRNLGR